MQVADRGRVRCCDFGLVRLAVRGNTNGSRSMPVHDLRSTSTHGLHRQNQNRQIPCEITSGRSSSGAVYPALDEFSQVEVAINVYESNPPDQMHCHVLLQFLTEACLAGRLEHPHIAKKYWMRRQARTSLMSLANLCWAEVLLTGRPRWP